MNNDNLILSASEIIEQLDCSNYYNSYNTYWFLKDPTIIFVIDSDDRISLKDLYSGKFISIYEIWNIFSLDQKKLLAFNLDKFK